MRSRIRSVLGWAVVGLVVGLALAAWDALAARLAAWDALAARLAALVEQGAAPAALAPPRPDARVAGLDAAVDADTAARLRELGYLR